MVNDIFRLRAILRQVRPDVLNTHGNTDSKVGLVAAWGLSIPCVIRTRHSTPPVGNSWHNRLLYRRLSDVVFTTAACVSRQIHRDLGVPEERIKTVPSGIDCPADLLDRDVARIRLAEELGLDDHQRFIGFVGRITGSKGVPVLIDAFAAIKDRIPDHHLVIVGDGNLFTELTRQVAERGLQTRIHLLGYRDDPWPYYRAMDIFVLTSLRYEGVPQSMLQAMFAQCAVIGTDVGGIPDIVSHGETGLLVPPEDPARLSEAFLHTIENPDATRKRVASALAEVQREHTLSAMGAKILTVYERTLQAAERDSNSA
ncbi:glycosyltransferase [Desulfosarcina cetonica]|uniref:glycosyltransferase n=1 Tax=Desulfosarcina cetonica TaxID=90730 RepID=UPI0006D26709|nr:glycosyltransferase [Desulfosarcina cetonica]